MCRSEPDSVLVERYCEQRDEDAFTTLMDRYLVPVYRLSASILGTRQAADIDNVVQEVFVRVYHALPSFRAESEFSTWLYRIAYNQSLSHKSQLAWRPEHVGSDQVSDVISDDGDPTKRINNEQLRVVLDAAIDRLPSEYQMAVRLFYWFQVPISEISLLSTTPENTVKSYLHRARKLLASSLKNQEGNL